MPILAETIGAVVNKAREALSRYLDRAASVAAMILSRTEVGGNLMSVAALTKLER